MTLWLTTQARTLGAIAGFALLLGLSGSASAEPGKAHDEGAKAGKKAAHHGKGKRTAQAHPKKKGDDKADRADKADKAHGADKNKKDQGAKKRGKTAQSHGQATRREQPHADKADKADKADDGCLRDAVEIGRSTGEEMKFSLTRCKGQPADKALERLAQLMRPYSVARPASLPDLHPKAGAKGLREGEILPGIVAPDPGLVSRLQAVASEFPGHKLTLVSGYRPGGTGAFHRHGRAIDLRVEGVKAQELATFCRSLVDTGCGFYPNGGFVHIDVRPKGTGHTYWIDDAGPGEPSHPVSSWPPPKDSEDVKPAKNAPHDDTNHGDIKKKAGHGAATSDRDSEDDELPARLARQKARRPPRDAPPVASVLCGVRDNLPCP